MRWEGERTTGGKPGRRQKKGASKNMEEWVMEEWQREQDHFEKGRKVCQVCKEVK